MNISLIFIFSISLFTFWCVYIFFGKQFALDYPNSRKHHQRAMPQIGGLIFGPLFLFFIGWFELAPYWYIIGGIISILIGAFDDICYVPWQFKLLVQLLLVAFLTYTFWDRFNQISFYNYTFTLNPLMLVTIFVIWFVGIYNAVNLLDGLDGLAGGFIFVLLLGIAASGSGNFFQINGMFALIILSFLVFNQRPAKLFMGDAGSLFLGFHIAVLPLLFSDANITRSTVIMTPFVLLSSYLIADTSRVFFTRLANKKSPMTPDTIHFHHLILQQSGSYLAATGSIHFTTLLSVIVAIFSFELSLSSNVMLAHLTLLMLFILIPPVKIYMPFLTQIIKPLYIWQKSDHSRKPLLIRTLFILLMFLGLIFSFFVYYDLSAIYDRYHLLGLGLLLFFCLFNIRDKMTMYVIQLTLIILFVEIASIIEFGILTKLFTALLSVSYFIFTLERRNGCKISNFSTLDLLMIQISFGGIIISILGFPISSWFFITMFAIWFSSRFIFYRTFYSYS